MKDIWHQNFPQIQQCKSPKEVIILSSLCEISFEPLETIQFSMFCRLSTDQSLFFGFWSKPPCTSGRLQHQRLATRKMTCWKTRASGTHVENTSMVLAINLANPNYWPTKKSCCVPCIKKNTMERWDIIWIHLIPDQVLLQSKLKRFVQGILMLSVDVPRQPPEFLDVSDLEMLVLASTLFVYQFFIITFPKKNSRHSKHLQMFQMKLKYLIPQNHISKTTSLPALPLKALPYMFFRSGQSLLCQ